jgi:Fur family peroxide stress response transcriptional regulator
MADSQTRYEQLIAKLRERDYRLTPQRETLVRFIAASVGHPSASQLYEQIKVQFPMLSRATVYKTLDLLKELGEVFEIDLRDDSRYDGNKPYPHPHLICVHCGAIMDGVDDLTQEMIVKMEQSSGYRIISHQLTFYGVCPACQDQG